MNERTRRQNPNRRQPQMPPLAITHHLNNRSIHQSNIADSYSSSNYRHPSTNTNILDPSSTASSHPSTGESNHSMCYSYLVAIFSSFLVVLGIYLSITRFNIRFLYISLVGFSIYAMGACLYCISNIHATKLARRKQRINSDEFILNGSTNESFEPGRTQRIATATHVLSNSTLTNRNNDNIRALDGNNQSAINSNNETQPRLNQQLSGSHTDLGDSVANTQQDVALEMQAESTGATNLARDQDRVDSITVSETHIEQLPKNLQPQQSPNTTSGDFVTSLTSLLEHEHNFAHPSLERSGTSLDPRGETSIDIVPEINNEIGDKQIGNSNENSTSPPSGQAQIAKPSEIPSSSVGQSSGDCPSTESDQIGTTTGNLDLTTIIQGSGLRATDAGAAEASVPRRKESQNQRPANLRRTLVMGLGGEEELIEIDEEDLDNMSILPPSYESITTNNKTNS